MLFFLLILLISYLIGSISFAIIFAKIFNLPDPRSTGSNNPGATNILRISGKKYAIIVLLADMLKGFLPIIICKTAGFDLVPLGMIALAIVLGHIYPIFFKFKGGKGVATALGVLLGLNLYLGVIVLLTWVIVALITRYSSMAAIVAVILTPFYAFVLMPSFGLLVILLIMAFIILNRHQANIIRLIQHTEPKI